MNPDSDRNQEDRPSYSDLIKPPPYPLDEALEQAYTPEHPTFPAHTEDDWEQDQRPTQQPGTGQAASPHSPTETGTVTVPQSTRAVPPSTETATGTASGATGRLLAAGQTLDQEAENLAHAPAQLDELDVTVAERLARMPLWQARIIMAMRELGNWSLVIRRCNVSRWSIERLCERSGDFAQALREAQDDATDLVEAAVYRGATIGDQRAVWHQGVMVGFERRRNVKDAELYLRLKGRLRSAGQEHDAFERRTGMSAPVTEEVGSLVGSILSALCSGHRGRPQIVDAEEVE